MIHASKPCPHCNAGIRVDLRGRIVRCNHRPPFYALLHPIAVILALAIATVVHFATEGETDAW